MTRGVKAPSACTKTECMEELTNFGIEYAGNLTVVELRSLVRQNRQELGLMKKDPTANPDEMDFINKANFRDLKIFVQENKIGFGGELDHGSLRAHLRQWKVRQGTAETKVNFGKHRGLTFEAVATQDPQYLVWATKEAAEKRGAHWQLVQMATWGIMSGKVPNPFDQGMGTATPSVVVGFPVCLENILQIDDDIYQEKNQEKGKLLLKSGSKKDNAPGSSRSGGEPEHKELLLQVQMLKQEIREMKEEQTSSMAPPSSNKNRREES